MKTVLRRDHATLRRPERTSQGFLRADGYFGRCGIYEYRNDDGSKRLELRPPEEVQSAAALASFDAASVTLGHPAEEVTSDNVRRHEVGSVSGAARVDGEHVAGSLVVKDARAIKQIESGKQELSPGYRIDLDETPGRDKRYATPSNPTGRYDAIQRNIRVNHLAVVDRARGGSTVRLRMDEAERVDGGNGKLTTSTAGHQHLVELNDWNGCPQSSGTTSWSVAEGAEEGHTHPWLKNADGTITIGESAGHAHGVLDDNRWAALAPAAVIAPRVDAVIDRSGMRSESGRMADPTMNADEQIRSLRAQLADAVAKLSQNETTATSHATRADQAEARVQTLTGEVTDLRAQIAAAATVVETAAITREKVRADAAEERVRQFDETFRSAVSARVALERRAAIVMGPEFRFDGISDREITSTVVKRLDAQADTSSKVSDAFLAGRFESLLELHARNARSRLNVAEVITVENQRRVDSLDEKRQTYRNQGLEPLPNDPRARKGA